MATADLLNVQGSEPSQEYLITFGISSEARNILSASVLGTRKFVGSSLTKPYCRNMYVEECGMSPYGHLQVSPAKFSTKGIISLGQTLSFGAWSTEALDYFNGPVHVVGI